jgi:hypothetical protein
MSHQKWYEVASGAKERSLFIGKDSKSGLVRGEYAYRSVAALTKESGLTREEVEKIIAKYLKFGLIVASPNKEDLYAYVHNVDTSGKEKKSLADSDQEVRLKKKKP